MAKKFKNWLDEFVTKGSDPKDVTNWPDSWGQNGGEGSTEPSSGQGVVNNVWGSGDYILAKEISSEDIGNKIKAYNTNNDTMEEVDVVLVERYAKEYKPPVGRGQTGYAFGRLGVVFFDYVWEPTGAILYARYSTDYVNWRTLTPLSGTNINTCRGTFLSDNIVCMQDGSYLHASFFDVNSGASVVVMHKDIDAALEVTTPPMFFVSFADGIYAGVSDPESDALMIYKNTDLFNGGAWVKMPNSSLKYSADMQYGIEMTYNNVPYYFWLDFTEGTKFFMTSDLNSATELPYENARFIYDTGAGLGVIWRGGSEHYKLTRILNIANGEPTGEDVNLHDFGAEQNVYYLNNNYWWVGSGNLEKLTYESGTWTATIVERGLYGEDCGAEGRLFFDHTSTFAVIDGIPYNEIAIDDNGQYVYQSDFTKIGTSGVSGQVPVRGQSVNLSITLTDEGSGITVPVDANYDAITGGYITASAPSGTANITGISSPASWAVKAEGVYDITFVQEEYREVFFRWIDGQGEVREGQGIGFYMKNGTPVSGYGDLQTGDNVTLVMGAIIFPEADTPSYTIPEFWLEFTGIHVVRFTML